jgi:hypothetical protein
MVKSIQRGFVNQTSAQQEITVTISAVTTAKCEIQYDRNFVRDSSLYRNEPTATRPSLDNSTTLRLPFVFENSGQYRKQGWWTVIEYE